MESARARIAEAVGCDAEEVIFTSGGSESNNFSLRGAITRPQMRIVVSAVEHPSVLAMAEWLRDRNGCELSVIPVDEKGLVRLEEAEKLIRKGADFVSVMHANNEVGAVQPIAEISKICRKAGALLHVDACQSFLKLPSIWRDVDLLTINAHKSHGPKGIGALVKRKAVSLEPLIIGGGHEGGMRSGTLNAPGIVGFGETVAQLGGDVWSRVAELRNALWEKLAEMVPNISLNGPEFSLRLPNNLNFSVGGFSGKALLQEMDLRGFQISTSSACHSTSLTPSHVLLAMGLAPDRCHEAVRVTLGYDTSSDDIARFAASFVASVEKLRGR